MDFAPSSGPLDLAPTQAQVRTVDIIIRTKYAAVVRSNVNLIMVSVRYRLVQSTGLTSLA